MYKCSIGWACLFLLALTAPLSGQTLPAAADTDWPELRDHCRELLAALDAAKTPLPDAATRSLRALLDKQPADAAAAFTAVQKLLEPHCLIHVHINPESRVKAARGPAAAVLQVNTATVVLVRIHNEGGVTSALAVRGPGLIGTKKEDGGWLEAGAISRARLSGRRLEYVALRLVPHEAGKREATFRFDVGQGTQDLGFRAEVPILFTVRTP